MSEICKLDLEDLDLKERTCVVTGKGNKTRMDPDETKAIQSLRDSINYRNE